MNKLEDYAVLYEYRPKKEWATIKALNEEHALQLVPKRIEAPEGFVAVGIRVVNKNGCPIGSPQEEGK